MKTRLLFTLLLFFSVLYTSSAQMTAFTYSENFPEYSGLSKLKFLKNGNTMLIQFGDKDMRVMLYGTDKKTISNELILPSLGKDFQRKVIKGFFDINGDAAVFIVAYPEKDLFKASLYRFLINGKTGKLIKEELLLQQDNVPAGNKQLQHYYENIYPWIHVEKDHFSDHYVVALETNDASDRRTGFRLIHFDPQHKEINKATGKASGYELKRINSLSVKNSKYVLLSTIGIQGDKASLLFMKLAKGNTNFVTKEYTYTESYSSVVCELEAEETTDNVQAIFRIGFPTQNFTLATFDNFVLPVNGETLEFSAPLRLEAGKTILHQNEVIKAKYMSENGNLIQDYLVDRNANQLFLSERSCNNRLQMDTDISYIELYEITLKAIAKDQKEKYKITIPHAHTVYRIDKGMVYASNRHDKNMRYDRRAFIGTFVQLLAGEKYNYVLVNNLESNMKKASVDMNFQQAVGSLRSYFYKIDNKTGEMTNGFLFNAPAPKQSNQLGFFETGDFNPATGEYATVYLNIDKEKYSGVVWFKLE